MNHLLKSKTFIFSCCSPFFVIHIPKSIIRILIVLFLSCWLFAGNLAFAAYSTSTFGNSMKTSGSEYVEIPHNAEMTAIETGDNVTISAWINITAWSTNCCFFSVLDAGNFTWKFELNDGSITFAPKMFDDNGTAFSFSFDTWYHVAVAHDGTNNKIYFYVNGNLLETLTGTSGDLGSTTTESLFIGRNPSGADEFNFGCIDELRIWDKAITTAAEIQSNMDSELVGNEANLVFYYNFNSLTGGQVTDLTGNGNHGTINGSPSFSTGCPGGSSSTEIPTMSEWAMIVFMILTGITGVYYLKKNEQWSISS